MTLRDLEEHWSFGDMYRAHKVLDALNAAEKEAERQARQSRG